MDVDVEDEQTTIELDGSETKDLVEALETLIEVEHNAAEKVGDDAGYHYLAESLLEMLKDGISAKEE